MGKKKRAKKFAKQQSKLSRVLNAPHAHFPNRVRHADASPLTLDELDRAIDAVDCPTNIVFRDFSEIERLALAHLAQEPNEIIADVPFVTSPGTAARIAEVARTGNPCCELPEAQLSPTRYLKGAPITQKDVPLAPGDIVTGRFTHKGEPNMEELPRYTGPDEKLSMPAKPSLDLEAFYEKLRFMRRRSLLRKAVEDFAFYKALLSLPDMPDDGLEATIIMSEAEFWKTYGAPLAAETQAEKQERDARIEADSGEKN